MNTNTYKNNAINTSCITSLFPLQIKVFKLLLLENYVTFLNNTFSYFSHWKLEKITFQDYLGRCHQPFPLKSKGFPSVCMESVSEK